MGGRSRPSDSKVTEQPTEKKKGLGDWMNLIKPVNEEKDHWVNRILSNIFSFCAFSLLPAHDFTNFRTVE